MARAIDRLAGVLVAALAPREAGGAAKGGVGTGGAAAREMAREMAAGEARMAAPGAAGGPPAPESRLDLLLWAMNRLPRPLLALGALGLFLYAALDPAGFARRMADLNAVPEPLWWLAGAVMAFYFGTREPAAPPPASGTAPPGEANAALDDWEAAGGDGAAGGNPGA